jgi:hypothetical protein
MFLDDARNNVMPGIGPGIHVFGRHIKDVDGRDKPGQDGFIRVG